MINARVSVELEELSLVLGNLIISPYIKKKLAMRVWHFIGLKQVKLRKFFFRHNQK